MKKSVMQMVVALVNGQQVEDMETLKNEINAEWERLTEKSRANAEAYAAAKDIVLAVMSVDKPMTAQEIFDACEGLPAGFTKNKVQYALLNYWEDKTEKHDNGKNPYTYSLKPIEDNNEEESAD